MFDLYELQNIINITPETKLTGMHALSCMNKATLKIFSAL
jgi:hypothetical protein